MKETYCTRSPKLLRHMEHVTPVRDQTGEKKSRTRGQDSRVGMRLERAALTPRSSREALRMGLTKGGDTSIQIQRADCGHTHTHVGCIYNTVCTNGIALNAQQLHSKQIYYLSANSLFCLLIDLSTILVVGISKKFVTPEEVLTT